MDSVIVIGHKNPDTDSVVSAMAFAALNNALGENNYTAARAGHVLIQGQLHIGGAFEFLHNGIIHLGTGGDIHGGQHSQASAFLAGAGGAEETLGAEKAGRIHHAGKAAPLLGRGGRIDLGQTGQAVHDEHDVLLLFHKAHGTLQHDLRKAKMSFRRLVKSGGQDRAGDRIPQEGYVFGVHVNHQHEDADIRIVFADNLGKMLHDFSFARVGRAEHEAALAEAQRRDQIDQAHIRE